MPSYTTPIVSTLSGERLEQYVTAIFQVNGYYCKSNLLWSESSVADDARSVDILQVDLLAYLFSPFSENRVLTECKGGGTFADFYKFSGIVNFIKPVSSFFVCNNSPVFDELHRLGNTQDIIVLRPNDIIDKYSSGDEKGKIDFFFWVNELQAALINKDKISSAFKVANLNAEQKLAFSEIRKYYSILNGKIWRILDPREQANEIIKCFSTYKGFVRKMLTIQKLPLVVTENAISQNVLCESAASVVLKARIDYITTAVRCAIASLISPDRTFLDTVLDTNFKTVVTKMVDNIQLACRLPQFLQFWIFQFGGMLNMKNGELSKLAILLNERDETIKMYIDFLKDIFSILFPAGGQINWGLHARGEILEFNNLPESIRGFGIYFRERNGIDTSGYIYKNQWLARLELFC